VRKRKKITKRNARTFERKMAIFVKRRKHSFLKGGGYGEERPEVYWINTCQLIKSRYKKGEVGLRGGAGRLLRTGS